MVKVHPGVNDADGSCCKDGEGTHWLAIDGADVPTCIDGGSAPWSWRCQC